MSALTSARMLEGTLSRSLAFAPPLLSRIVIGVVFVQSGWGKLHHLEQVTQFFQSLGIPFPELQAPFVASVELACGALVLVGLATRLAAIPLIGTMVVALATALVAEITDVGALFGLSEFLYIVLLVQLIVGGAGSLSLDRVVARWIDAQGEAARRQLPTANPS